MLRIEYSNVKQLQLDYLNDIRSYKKGSLRNSFNSNKQKKQFRFDIIFDGIDFDDLLIMTFPKLLITRKKIEKNLQNVVLSNQEREEIEKIFPYTKLQPKWISKFFETHNQPVTCYYCNIDFINVFNDNGETKNGFTLDHVLDKGKYPFFAISLFNLVPSCYTCNTKLKGTEDIGEASPTDSNFDFDQKKKFKIFLNGTRQNNISILIKNAQNVRSELIGNAKEYDKYMEVFCLNDRYQFHNYKIIEMIQKREEYSDTRIQELSVLTKRTPERVKMDLFGENLYDKDLWQRPLSKFTKDIAENLGII